jgi:hypothetical protein
MSLSNNAISIDSSYQTGNLSASERYHREAIYHFEKKLMHEPKCVVTLCDWIASYHELASLYDQKGSVERAQKCLLIPHQSMLYMALHNDGDVEKEEIAMRAISVTLPPLMAFAKQHPPCDKCMQSLKIQLDMTNKRNKTDH